MLQDAPIVFETAIPVFTAQSPQLDQRQRFGNYFDFFWRAKRPSDVTVRLEYRQEKLHEHVQAQEISYRNVRGTHKTEFKVIGDDYFDDGRVIAWRCLLIANGRIVAENRSFHVGVNGGRASAPWCCSDHAGLEGSKRCGSLGLASESVAERFSQRGQV